MHIRKWILGVVLGMSVVGLSPREAKATDIPIFPTGPVFTFSTPLVWGNSSAQGFNNNFFFTPFYGNGSVCVSVLNNNPSNPHTFSASILINSNPFDITPSDTSWQSAASASFTVLTSPSQPVGIGSQVSGVARVSINFSASSTQAGNPDTASITVVQTQGNCFSGSGSIGSAPSTVSAVPQIQAVSEGLSSAFFSTTTVVNPTAGQAVLSIQGGNGPRTLYFYKANLNSTAAAVINISGSTTTGTCTSATPVNMRPTGSGASATANGPCTVNPTAISGTQFVISVPVGVTVTVDLSGFIAQNGTQQGLTFYSSAVTGTVTTTAEWFEK